MRHCLSTALFTTSNTPPAITSFSGTPGTAYTYDVITFTASASDQDGFVVRHEWDFNGMDIMTVTQALFQTRIIDIKIRGLLMRV